ncbi:glycoside hydrolase family 27 protein [Spirochaeta dissipatitropha]
MLCNTPPMGWNSWNTFGSDITEQLIIESAEALVSSGLKDAGYKYVVIDDCWSERERDESGRLVPDRIKFPNGIAALAGRLHDMDLKLGIYSCAGVRTCAGYPGSFEHEFDDARTFAAWGIDYLKYDYCYKPDGIPGEILFRRMAAALRNSGRDILFAACNWGNDNAALWMRSAGAHIWRSTGDIFDSWSSIKELILLQDGLEPYTAPQCWNDMDMLVAGMQGKGNVARGGCSEKEYETHFSLWSLMSSALMLGCDIRNLDESSKKLFTNKGLIRINQDSEGRPCYVLPHWNNSDCRTYVKLLSDGSYAIGLFNLGETRSETAVHLWDIGIPANSGHKVEIHDVLNPDSSEFIQERYSCMLEAHTCRIIHLQLRK